MKKTKIKIVVIIVLAITIVSLSIILNKEQENTVQTSTQSVSNKKIGWGIKRNNNQMFIHMFIS